MRLLPALSCAVLLACARAAAAVAPSVSASDGPDAVQIYLTAEPGGGATLVEHRSRERKGEREGDMTVQGWASANRTFKAGADGRLLSVGSEEDVHWQADEEVAPGPGRDARAAELLGIAQNVYKAATLEELAARANAGGAQAGMKQFKRSEARFVLTNLETAGRYFAESDTPPGAEDTIYFMVLETEVRDHALSGTKDVFHETTSLFLKPDGSPFKLTHQLIKRHEVRRKDEPTRDDQRAFETLRALYLAKAPKG